jgi:hypothetical protein
MTRAGHSSYATTKRYIDLAGERFRWEADRLERRPRGDPLPSSGTKSDGPAAEEKAGRVR